MDSRIVRSYTPKVVQTHSGYPCLELSEDVSWEGFDAHSNEVAAIVNGQVVERLDWVDVRWLVVATAFGRLRIYWDDFPCSFGIEPADYDVAFDLEPVRKLFSDVNDAGGS